MLSISIYGILHKKSHEFGFHGFYTTKFIYIS